jgi:cytochrome P450
MFHNSMFSSFRNVKLARLETQIALQTLVRRFPNLQLENGFTPTYLPNMAFRALEKLSVHRSFILVIPNPQ